VSKAFTREDASQEIFAPARAPLPPGTKNYITKGGADRIQAELAELIQRKRNLPSASESEQQALDSCIQHLQSLVASFVVVEPTASDLVRFGAVVTLKRGAHTETYTLVGVDEIDLDQNHISWLSPLARALMSHRVGERVSFKSPAGMEQLEILSVR
jgi:transcription elongation factor GreB